jgi:hypothetical protein
VIQAIKIVRCSNVREVCMMFDHDAIDATWRSIGNLNNRITVTVAEMPGSAENKKLDPNDDVDAAVEAFQTRKLYTYGSAMTKLVLSSGQEPTVAGKKLRSFRHEN